MPLVPEPQPPMSELRAKAFNVAHSELELEEAQTGPVWAVFMETGFPEALISLLVFADGSTSLYFGNGGGVIGAGEHEAVRVASASMLREAAASLPLLSPVDGPDLPQVGEVKFYARTYATIQDLAVQGVSGQSSSSLFSAAADEQTLLNTDHSLTDLFAAGHAVIAAIREHTPQPELTGSSFCRTP